MWNIARFKCFTKTYYSLWQCLVCLPFAACRLVVTERAHSGIVREPALEVCACLVNGQFKFHIRHHSCTNKWHYRYWTAESMGAKCEFHHKFVLSRLLWLRETANPFDSNCLRSPSVERNFSMRSLFFLCCSSVIHHVGTQVTFVFAVRRVHFIRWKRLPAVSVLSSRHWCGRFMRVQHVHGLVFFAFNLFVSPFFVTSNLNTFYYTFPFIFSFIYTGPG